MVDEARLELGCVGWRSGGFANALRERRVRRGAGGVGECTFRSGARHFVKPLAFLSVNSAVAEFSVVAQAGMPTPGARPARICAAKVAIRLGVG